MRGWIALDIDGTITIEKYSVPKEVIRYLDGLQREGWSLALVTGRPFAFAKKAIENFAFPFVFICQNGSIALEMPERKVIFKSYISKDLIPLLEEAYEGIEGDYLIYAGFEHGDFCFWRPHLFSQDEMQYVKDLQTRQNEEWQAVDFKSLPIDDFPLVKCFGSDSQMMKVAERLKKMGKFEVANIRDPFALGIRILLVTAANTSKGKSLSKLFELRGRGDLVIAAGDDENDISLLESADVKIAMAHAPESLVKVADFIAPPTEYCGIIHALQLAIGKNGIKKTNSSH